MKIIKKYLFWRAEEITKQIKDPLYFRLYNLFLFLSDIIVLSVVSMIINKHYVKRRKGE